MLRKRHDMIGNKWGKQFKKGHKINYKTGVSTCRKKVKRLKCSSCGKSVEFKDKKRKKKECNLDVHHKDHNKYNNKKNNLKVLCRSCHMKLHIKQGDRIYEKGIIPWNKGKKGLQVAWNKGLTKETDERVDSYSKKLIGNKNFLGGGKSVET